MIARFVLAGFLAGAAVPAAAQDSALFEPGTVLCSNFDQRTRSCRTITTVTALKNGLRTAYSRRMVAMPDENLLLETESISRVEGNRVCVTGESAPPRISPDHHSYAQVLLAVYQAQLDKRIARGTCHEYRRCGARWHVYLTYPGDAEPKLVSLTTIYRPDDPKRLGLQLRYREFGITEPTPSECDPIG